MDTTTLVLIEGGLIFGAIMLLAFRELWSLRRDRREEAARAATEGVDTPAVDRAPVSDAPGASGTAASPAPPDGRSA